MKYYLISYETGHIRTTIKAENLEAAQKICEEKNLDYINDYFLESEKEIENFEKSLPKNTRYRSDYIDDLI